ncbi:hypothetical protein BT96DRAFT_1000897 [Gymnopus androsaceus JB14]|uniref:Uncharacterized protein n=1 Tax=Gymnopus androsaceus JB14 TaxID=1447944 RepID=A0A6A4H460_9AGAR|nr:hypothetical protein BT96DRAFT_1000897 [Gymnopus androsaceus JB14]
MPHSTHWVLLQVQKYRCGLKYWEFVAATVYDDWDTTVAVELYKLGLFLKESFASEDVPYAKRRYPKRLYGVLEIRLSPDRDWLVGLGRGTGIETLDECPNVKRWLETVQARPGFSACVDVGRTQKKLGQRRSIRVFGIILKYIYRLLSSSQISLQESPFGFLE